MTTAKVNNPKELSKFQRRQIALGAIAKTDRPKPEISISEVRSYATFVQVFYLENGEQRSALIKIKNLMAYLMDCPGMLPADPNTDVHMAYYLEENMQLVCAAYLAAGKEIMQ